MTEQETREKIVEVLKKSREEWEIITPYIGILDEPRVDIEIDKLADALIAAGLGFKDKHRVFVQNAPLLPYNDDDVYFVPNTQPKITQLYGDEEVEQIVKERKELKDELRSKVEYIHEQDEVVKEYKHCAQVAENELKLYKLAVKIWQERYSDIRCFNFNIALRQAEKELSEEEKE